MLHALPSFFTNGHCYDESLHKFHCSSFWSIPALVLIACNIINSDLHQPSLTLSYLLIFMLPLGKSGLPWPRYFSSLACTVHLWISRLCLSSRNCTEATKAWPQLHIVMFRELVSKPCPLGLCNAQSHPAQSRLNYTWRSSGHHHLPIGRWGYAMHWSSWQTVTYESHNYAILPNSFQVCFLICSWIAFFFKLTFACYECPLCL